MIGYSRERVLQLSLTNGLITGLSIDTAFLSCEDAENDNLIGIDIG